MNVLAKASFHAAAFKSFYQTSFSLHFPDLTQLSVPLFTLLSSDNPEKLQPGLLDSLQPALLVTARRYNLVGVTRRQHRHGFVPVDQKAVTVQGGYGVVFAIRVQDNVEDTRVAVQS